MARSVGPILLEEVLDNLGNFASNPNAIASHADIGSGSVKVTGAVTPSVSIPFGNTVVRGATAIVTGVTNPYRSLTMGANLERQGSWSLSAVVDPVRMANMAALYRYAISGNAADLSDYHLPTKVQGNKVGVDPAYLTSRYCVYCVDLAQFAKGHINLDAIPESDVKKPQNINPLLKIDPDHPWLRHFKQPVEDLGGGLGKHGGEYLYVNEAPGKHPLSDFVLFVLSQKSPAGPEAASARTANSH